jgi:glucose-6-phosphate isomerase
MRTAHFNEKAILAITPDELAHLKDLALQSPKQRYRLCMHYSTRDSTQEMVIVCLRDTVMPPHRHPVGRTESYHIIEGSMTVCFFDDFGQVFRKLEMGEPMSGKAFLYRASEPVWHAPVPSSDWLIYHETLTGPYEPENVVEFPPWMPAGSDEVRVRDFLRRAIQEAAYE